MAFTKTCRGLAWLADQKADSCFRELQVRDKANTHSGDRESASLDEPETPLILSGKLELAFAMEAAADKERPRSRQGRAHRAALGG